jgi:hypothetical protein
MDMSDFASRISAIAREALASLLVLTGSARVVRSDVVYRAEFLSRPDESGQRAIGHDEYRDLDEAARKLGRVAGFGTEIISFRKVVTTEFDAKREFGKANIRRIENDIYRAENRTQREAAVETAKGDA